MAARNGEADSFVSASRTRASPLQTVNAHLVAIVALPAVMTLQQTEKASNQKRRVKLVRETFSFLLFARHRLTALSHCFTTFLPTPLICAYILTVQINFLLSVTSPSDRQTGAEFGPSSSKMRPLKIFLASLRQVRSW